MSKAVPQSCDCGCGRSAYHSQLVVATIETAIDESLRQSKTSKRFWVLRECKSPFEEELGLMVLLKMMVAAYPPPPRTRYWLINAFLNPFYPWPRLLRSWWKRVGAARKVIQIQHGIYIRPKQVLLGPEEGFEWTRRHAMQSGILFGCPRFMQGFLAKRFLIRAKRRELKRVTHGAGPNTAETA